MSAYATLAELKTQLRLTTSTDDVELQDRLDAAKNRIDKDCGRTFDVFTGSATQREYAITNEFTLIVDDFAAATDLAVAIGSATGSAVASTNYRIKPDNNLAKLEAAWILETRGTYRWLLGRQTAYVTARWGWPTVPDAIHDANLLLAARLFKRKDTPWGVAGSGDMGLIRIAATDSDYRALIDGYIRPQV